MKTAQLLYINGDFLEPDGDEFDHDGALFVLGYGSKRILLEEDIYWKLKFRYPYADIVLCSTSGEIYDDVVHDNSVSIIIMEFEKTWIKPFSANIKDHTNSFEAGKAIFKDLNTNDLAYVLVISDGGMVNGSELVRGIQTINIKHIPVTGGLAGDADRFDSTVVGCNEVPAQGNIVGVGFYGNKFEIGHGSLGGWDMFGPEKIVTRSESNRLFEIDNKNALGLYKQYLGKYADELPGSALLFPLYVRLGENENGVVRTILSINSEEQSMVFAGDIPEGSYVRFMKANFDKLIDAATSAAGNSLLNFQNNTIKKPQIALLISCVGRKLILGKRIDEEIEAVKDVFGEGTLLTGFYSYGEISPLSPNVNCELHNQTMTVTTFSEDCHDAS